MLTNGLVAVWRAAQKEARRRIAHAGAGTRANHTETALTWDDLERTTGFEPATLTLAMRQCQDGDQPLDPVVPTEGTNR